MLWERAVHYGQNGFMSALAQTVVTSMDSRPKGVNVCFTQGFYMSFYKSSDLPAVSPSCPGSNPTEFQCHPWSPQGS